MAERLTKKELEELEFSSNLLKRKSVLDERFCFPSREKAELIIAEMKDCVSEDELSALGALERNLLESLSLVPEYVEAHGKKYDDNGRAVAEPLLNSYFDKDEVSRAIEEYEKYIDCMPEDDSFATRFWETAEELYNEYKSSSAYMSRLVKNILADYNKDAGTDEYKYDLSQPTRLLILKHFLRQFGIVSVSDGKVTEDEILDALIGEEYGGRIENIDDSIFEHLKILNDYVNATAKIIGIIKLKGSYVQMNPVSCEKLCGIVNDDKLSDGAKESTAKLLSDCFTEPCDKLDFSWLRPLEEITVNFKRADEIQTLKKENGKKYKQELTCIAAGIYSEYYSELKKCVSKSCPVKTSTFNDATKRGGEIYDKLCKRLHLCNNRLIDVAEALTSENFSGQPGIMKEYLYIFAVAFDMTYITQEDIENKRVKPGKNYYDIQKNLFYDYYSDNIVNNGFDLTDNTNATGQGVNLKNFAEAAFIWGLKQEELEAKEKLKKIYSVITYVKKRGKSAEYFKALAAQGENVKTVGTDSLRYADDFFADKVIKKSEKELKAYLVKEYVYEKNGKNIMTVNSGSVSAYDAFSAQLEQINELAVLVNSSGKLTPEEKGKEAIEALKLDFFDDYNIKEQDMTAEQQELVNDIIGNIGNKMKKASLDSRNAPTDNATLTDSLSALQELDTQKGNKLIEFLGGNIYKILVNISSRLSPERIYMVKDKTKEVSRTDILALSFYHTLILISNMDDFDSLRNLSFSEFFESFTEGTKCMVNNKRQYLRGANYFLESAGYQLINSKNLLDIYIIFLAYKAITDLQT